MSRLAVHRQLDFARSLADVFAYLADFSTTEQWDPGVSRGEKCTPGAVRVGSEFELQLRVLGRSVPVQYRVRELQPQCLIVLDGNGAGFTVVDTIRLEALDAQRTRLHYSAEMELAWAPGALSPLLKPWGERLGDVAMRGLRQALENDGIEHPSRLVRAGERLLLPALCDFTARGYRRQQSRGLSRRLDGKTVGITGATSGLGLAAAQLLGRLGANLVLVGRGEQRLADAAQSVREFAGEVPIRTYAADLSLLREVRALGETLQQQEPQLDVWINNAGALFAERGETDEGHERALAINLLSPALLSQLLAPQLQARGGRLINVASGGLYGQPLRLDDLQYRSERYDGSKAYARAKRGLLALTQRWAADSQYAGLTFSAMHPGWAATPGVEKSLPRFNRLMHAHLRDARMGADTMVWLASHPQLQGREVSGHFWFDRAQRPTALLPGTAVSEASAEQLQATLDALFAQT